MNKKNTYLVISHLIKELDKVEHRVKYYSTFIKEVQETLGSIDSLRTQEYRLRKELLEMQKEAINGNTNSNTADATRTSV